MNTAKIVLAHLKTDHKFLWMLTTIVLAFGCIFLVFFGKSIGLETNTKNLITSGLVLITCLMSFLVHEKSKSLYLFMSGFFSAVFLIALMTLLGYSW